MARTKIIDYPELSVTDAIEAANKIVNTFKSGSITPQALAQALGHKNETSGTFLVKIADLKKYKIIDGRGTYIASELAKRIATGIGAEKTTAIIDMIFNITILKQLYDVFQQNINPSEEEFYTQLLNISKQDRAEVKSISEEIRKLYIDAVKYINVNVMANASVGTSTTFMAQQPQSPAPQVSTAGGTILFVADKINLSLPENVTNLELIKLAIENRIKELSKADKDKE